MRPKMWRTRPIFFQIILSNQVEERKDVFKPSLSANRIIGRILCFKPPALWSERYNRVKGEHLPWKQFQASVVTSDINVHPPPTCARVPPLGKQVQACGRTLFYSSATTTSWRNHHSRLTRDLLPLAEKVVFLPLSTQPMWSDTCYIIPRALFDACLCSQNVSSLATKQFSRDQASTQMTHDGGIPGG